MTANVKTKECAPVKITDAPEAASFTGSLLLSLQPFEFTPEAVLDKMGRPKENRPSFTLRPFNAQERHWMEADDRRMTAGGVLWALQNNIDISDAKNQLLLITKFAEFSDTEGRCDIIRKCIIDWRNVDSSDAVHFKDGVLLQTSFDRIPDEIVAAIGNELSRRANPGKFEALGL